MVAPSQLVRALLLVGLAALALYPLVGSSFYLQLMAKIMILAIFAMSLDLLVGFTGLVSLGHAAFFGIGAYVLMLLSPDYAAANLWLSLPVAIATAAIAAARRSLSRTPRMTMPNWERTNFDESQTTTTSRINTTK